MKDQLIKVANELSDLASAYEEKVTQKSWITDGWKALMEQLYQFDPDEFNFPEDADPTEVLHTVFLRLQEHTTNKSSKKYYWGDAIAVDRPQVLQVEPAPVAAPAAEVNFGEFLRVREEALRQQMVFQQENNVIRVNPFMNGIMDDEGQDEQP